MQITTSSKVGYSRPLGLQSTAQLGYLKVCVGVAITVTLVLAATVAGRVPVAPPVAGVAM